MSIQCANCGFYSPPGMRFCGNCGARLPEPGTSGAQDWQKAAGSLGPMMGGDLAERMRTAGVVAYSPLSITVIEGL